MLRGFAYGSRTVLEMMFVWGSVRASRGILCDVRSWDFPLKYRLRICF
jgi:hypothetical protein